jgi:hypothetical protein
MTRNWEMKCSGGREFQRYEWREAHVYVVAPGRGDTTHCIIHYPAYMHRFIINYLSLYLHGPLIPTSASRHPTRLTQPFSFAYENSLLTLVLLSAFFLRTFATAISKSS